MTTFEPLTEKDYSRLESFLLSDPEESTLLLSETDGLLAALSIVPEQVPQDEWLEIVFGPRCSSLADAVHPDQLISIAVRMQQEIAQGLSSEPPHYEPILDVDTDGSLIGEIWAEGFRRGMDLRYERWQPLLESKVSLVMLTPIIALADDEVLRRIEPRLKKRRKLAKDYTEDLYLCARALYRFARKTRLELLELDAQAETGARAEKSPVVEQIQQAHKAGRNDPCPCGSGKKFKRCCGVAV